MATRNRNIEPILNLVQKRNTKSKRTKVLIKKSKELSILCNLDINITIYDSTINKVQQFTTKRGFTVESIYSMIKNEQKNKGTNAKKFKMKIINCEENQGIMNDSGDSDDCDDDYQVKFRKQAPEEGKNIEHVQDIIMQQQVVQNAQLQKDSQTQKGAQMQFITASQSVTTLPQSGSQPKQDNLQNMVNHQVQHQQVPIQSFQQQPTAVTLQHVQSVESHLPKLVPIQSVQKVVQIKPMQQAPQQQAPQQPLRQMPQSQSLQQPIRQIIQMPTQPKQPLLFGGQSSLQRSKLEDLKSRLLGKREQNQELCFTPNGLQGLQQHTANKIQKLSRADSTLTPVSKPLGMQFPFSKKSVSSLTPQYDMNTARSNLFKQSFYNNQTNQQKRFEMACNESSQDSFASNQQQAQMKQTQQSQFAPHRLQQQFVVQKPSLFKQSMHDVKSQQQQAQPQPTQTQFMPLGGRIGHLNTQAMNVFSFNQQCIDHKQQVVGSQIQQSVQPTAIPDTGTQQLVQVKKDC